jgi:hypothetical protein
MLYMNSMGGKSMIASSFMKQGIIALFAILYIPISFSYGACIQWKHECEHVRSCNFWTQANNCYSCFKNVYELNAPHETETATCNSNEVRFLQSEGYECRYIGKPKDPHPLCLRWSTKYICKMLCVKTV